MADVAKSYGVGDAVFVAYPFPNSLAFVAQARTVERVDILDGANEALVTFTDGEKVQDGAVVTVYDTAALASAAIVTDVIAKSAAAVALDATNSVASTGGQASVTLGRVD